MAHPLRDRSTALDELLVRRLDAIVPKLMERHGFEAWVLIVREYNEEPVLKTMLPATWLETARRRTILVFKDYGRERAAVARYPVGPFPSAWDPETQPDQWAALGTFLDGVEGHVGINTSETFPLADGLSATEHQKLVAAMPDANFQGAENLAIGWLETRLGEEVDAIRSASVTAHRLLRRALSNEVVTPGVTTTADVAWWLRRHVEDAGYQSWFHPGVTVQRAGAERIKPSDVVPELTIEPGDLLHIDFGIVAGGYHTDQQQHAYILKPGEAAVPESLRAGLEQGNRLQDILMEEMSAGRTGNAVLAATLRRAADQRIRAVVYTHPIGLHGHAAGSTIGLWDRQDGVPGAGDYPLGDNTAWSIELAVQIDIEEWDGQPGQIMLEEDAFLSESQVEFLDGRQTELWLIDSTKA